MGPNTNNWTLGEVAVLRKQERILKKSGKTTYKQYVNSRYLCIREESANEHGILLKVLGKTTPKHISFCAGEPFSKDDIDTQFYSSVYYGYPYVSSNELEEALSILRENPKLLNLLEEASMRTNPASTFWVRDIKRNLLFQKQLQYMNGKTGELCRPSDNEPRYRISIVYFYKGELIW